MLFALTGINWFIPLYLLAIYGLVAYFKIIPKEEKQKGTINWTPIESIAVTLMIYFVSQIVGSVVIYLLARLFSSSGESAISAVNENVIWRFLLIVVIDGLLIWLLNKFIVRRGATLKTIGLSRKPKLTDAGYVILGYLLYMAVYIIAILIANNVTNINLDQKQEIGFDNVRGISLIFVFISLVILPAFIEEILARGFLYSGLKKGLNIFWAVLITSFMFGIAHLQAGGDSPLLWIAAIDTFILSLVLILIKEKSGSLWAPIGLHALKNSVTFLFLFVFTLS